jgi:hypothetical protein
MQQHRDHLALPWPSRPCRNNRQIRKPGGDCVEMARMTGIEGDAIAARQPSPKPGPFRTLPLTALAV